MSEPACDRSGKTIRSPPQRQDDSTAVDPNASSCPLCEQKDTEKMVECEKCKNWFHFQCVNVDSSVASISWMCPGCTGRTKSTGNASVRTSTSSKRQSLLLLEKLAREKAIQDNLIEEKMKLAQQQADVDSEFLQKEFEIRESMTDAEDDDETVGVIPEKADYVADWLQTTEPSRPPNISELLAGFKTTKEELMKRILDTPYQVPILETVPKHVQFTHASTDESMDKSSAHKPIVGEVDTLPPEDPNEQSHRGNVTQHFHFVPPPLTEGTRPPDHRSNRWLPTYTTSGRSGTGPANFVHQPPNASDTPNQRTIVPNLMDEVDKTQAASNVVNEPMPTTDALNSTPQLTFVIGSSSIPQPFSGLYQTWAPAASHQSLFVSSSQQNPPPWQPQNCQQQTTLFDPNNQRSLGSAHQVTVTGSTHQPPPGISLQQQNSSTPVSFVQSTAQSGIGQSIFNSNCQQFVPTANQHFPFGSISVQPTGLYPNPQQYTPSSSYQPHSVPISIYQQPIVSSIANQRLYVPSSMHQPTFAPNSTLQPPVPFNPSLGSLNTGFNTNVLGTSQQMSLNHWTNYDPQLNPQQLPPTRLQLAARQTMSKDYPKFNGDPERWSIFYNAYVNCTTTCGLSNGENLGRLERCLEDPARKAVKNLLTRPEAVPDIIETLKLLYGRPEASIEAQLQIIRKEAAPKMHKMDTFIDFAMSVKNVTSEIQKTVMWQYLWNPQLMQELVDKLPYQMRMEWGQIKTTTPNVNLRNLSDWLFLRARTACMVTLPTAIEKKSGSNDKPNSSSHVNTHSKSANSNKNSSRDNSNTKSGNACNGKSHDISECRRFLGMQLSDRWETVKTNKLCRICLGRHHVLRCDSKSLCGESGCTVKHHRLLHNPTKTVQTATILTNSISNGGIHSAHQQNKIVILRRYIPVTLFGPKGSLNVLAFLDEGSDMTLVENQVIQKLGLTGIPTALFLEWTAKIVRKEPNSKSVTFKISGTQTQHKKYEIKDARTVKSLDLPSQTVNVDQMKDTYGFLRRIPIESYTDQAPKILIGLRDCRLSTPLKVRSGEWNQPIATKTLLGWEIHGSDTPSAQISRVNFHVSKETDDDDKLHEMFAQFFSLENFGVKKPEETIEATSDKRAKQLLDSTTRRIGNKFETRLLWMYDDVSLPDSFPMAKRRLLSLEKRLEKDPILDSRFRSKFHEYVEKGYVRKLKADENIETNERTWYLPLFPVTYPKMPEKIRLMWDAAAKVSNISLNSMLLSGPDLLVSLAGVLYRFRQGAYAVTGDIREMFHQIWIRKEDQSSQRFLWREKGSSEIATYVLRVMSFGATCSPSSAQYVKNRNAREFVEQHPKAEMAIRTNTYVDDWIQAFDTISEAENVANEVKEIYSLGDFEIRNWLTNSPQISRSLGASLDNEQILCIGTNETQTERVLGMWWNVKQDTFTYSLRFNPLNKEILFNARRPTKREALHTLMSIYDPLGFLTAYLVQLKIVLQDMWRIGIGWDEQIKEADDDGLYIRWLNWINLLPEIENIRINRHYSSKISSTNAVNIELHMFVDASELAYAAVAYFRIDDENGVECALIGGKTKVAPPKPLSVPRTELQAAVLGARFKNSVIENHTIPIHKSVIWSDSSTVLSWLRSDLRKYNQFVGARVGEILETTTLSEWRWIPSKLNPADDATKWKDSFSLSPECRWFKGPDFLLQAEGLWPKKKIDRGTQEELRPKYVHVHTKGEVEMLSIKFEAILQWKRTMTFVHRFVNNVKAKLGKPGFTIQTGALSRKELQEGENALYRKAQSDEFSIEIRKLKEEPDSHSRRPSVDRTSSLYRYSPFIDYAGVLRMRGRIDAASNVSIDQKRPIILPTKLQITDLVVKDYHIRYKHLYTETVINEIKQKFVIPRLRALFKRIRRTCQHCKNATVRPKPPEMAQLPAGRLASFTRPYTFVGVDYAGPYMISQLRKNVKRWIVVFTCLTIRAVYIDCVESLTSDSCIMAINRFTARNGTPREFYSDRGTNFVRTTNWNEKLQTSTTRCLRRNLHPPTHNGISTHRTHNTWEEHGKD